MSIRIGQRDKRALAGLVLALAVYAVATELAFPAWDRLEDAPGIAAERESQLQRYRRALVRQGRYQELAVIAEARNREFDAVLIRAENAELASVQLQSIVESAAAEVGVTFGERNIIAPRSLDAFFSETAMSVNFDCTPNQLASLLAEFGESETLLTVRQLQIQPSPSDGANRTKQLRVSLVVGALLEGA